MPLQAQRLKSVLSSGINPRESDESWPAWKAPELPALLFLSLLLALLALPRSPMLRDLDIGWLVRTGEYLWQHRQLPREDIFSFTQAGRPWVLYQWGSELLFGGLHRLAGLGGVVWGTALVIALTYSLLLYWLLKMGVSRLGSLGIVILVILTNCHYWFTRPATLTFLLYTVILLILEDYHQAPGKKIWALPGLFILWANLHLGFTLALGVVGLYAVALFFFPAAARGLGHPRDARLLLLYPFCLIAVCLNPYGVKLLAAFYEHVTSGFIVRGQLLEVQSPNFHEPAFICFFILIALLIWTGGRDYPGRPLLLTLVIATLGLSLYCARQLSYFSISAALHLGHALTPARKKAALSASTAVLRRGWGWACLAALLSLLMIGAIERRQPGFYGFEPGRVPEKTAAYLARQSSGSRPLRVFSWNDQWASYFIYRLYPAARVFIDTRFDFYGDTFVKQWSVWRDEALQNPAVLNPWQVDFLVLDKKLLRQGQRLQDLNWPLVYEDEQALVYRPLRAVKAAPAGKP